MPVGYASRVRVCSTKERCSGGDLDELLERCRLPFGVAEKMRMFDTEIIPTKIRAFFLSVFRDDDIYICSNECMIHIQINLELAVLALARIMCANIHSQNGTAILAQELLSRK